MPRHWERIEKTTNCTFDVENENFQLRNIMEAPLLENKEDIEVGKIAFLLGVKFVNFTDVQLQSCSIL